MPAHAGTNAAKLARVRALQAVYTEYLQKCVTLLIDSRLFTLERTEKREFFPQEKRFSSQIAKNCQGHAVGMVQGWAASLYTNKVKRRIRVLAHEGWLGASLARSLHCVGKYSIDRPTTQITQQAIDLYWEILLDSGRRPTVSDRQGMVLSTNTAKFTDSSDSVIADHWLQISTLFDEDRLARGERHPSKQVSIPIVGNRKYIQSAKEATKGILLKFNRHGLLVAQVVERQRYHLPKPVSAKEVSIDVGMNAVAATSGGDLFGQHVGPECKRRMREIQVLRDRRSAEGMGQDSPRITRLENRLTGYMITEINTVANSIARRHPGATAWLEALDLTGTKGQKRFLYKHLHNSLEQKMICRYVNPAYTSQPCPPCGHVARGNRRGQEFRCLQCGYRANADTVGSINILRRSKIKNIEIDDSPSVVRRELARLYWVRRNGCIQDCPQDFLNKYAPLDNIENPYGRRRTLTVHAASAAARVRVGSNPMPRFS